MALLFLGSSPDRGQSPVEWGEILYIITSICTSVPLRLIGRPSGPSGRPSDPFGRPQTPLEGP